MAAVKGTWIYPKGSRIRIREIINRRGGEVFGNSFQVTVPGKLTGNGRLRKQFPTRGDAEEWAEIQHTGLKKMGEDFVQLEAPDMRKAAEALEVAKKHGLDLNDLAREAAKPLQMVTAKNKRLLDVVNFALARMCPEGGDKTVREVVDEMIVSKQNRFKSGQLRDRSLGDFRVRATKFAEKFGARWIKDLTHKEIKAWILSLKISARSNRNYLAILRDIFRFAKQRKYVYESPLAEFADDDLKEMRGNGDEHSEPNVLTVDLARRLLETAAAHPELDLLAAVTLGLFCGIRTQELTKLEWGHVTINKENPKESFVTVPKGIAKKRRIRHVSLSENALEWLGLCPNREGKITRNSYSSDYRKRFYKLQQLAGFGKVDENGKWRSTWEENNMRHSFGSYHYALHGDSMKTAQQLGHRANDNVLFDHYRALAAKERAEAYFNLRPTNVVEMPKT